MLRAAPQKKRERQVFVPPKNPAPLVVQHEVKDGEAERFWAHVAQPDERGCRKWLMSCHGSGHGQFDFQKAHRVAWRLTFGPIPEGKNINHLCDVPPCCEPSHLWCGTQAENMLDMAAKGRGRRSAPRGEDSASAKLNWHVVREIRALRTTGWTLRQLADKFGISPSQISNVANNLQWIDPTPTE